MSTEAEKVIGDNQEWFEQVAQWKEEELHPDLKAWVVDTEFGEMVKHPLVYMHLMLPGQANAAYRQKTKALAEAIEDKHWWTVVQLHERPCRLDALIEYVIGRDEFDMPLPALTVEDPDMRDLICWVWTDSENIHQHVEDWMMITEGHNPGDPLIFCDNEDEWAKLPDRIEVWRGDCNDGGWSWTTDRKVALFFCRRGGEGNDLLHGWVDKHNVFGYLHNRNESEVMVRREYVEDFSRTPYEEGMV
jgi:hypothetical protein